MKIEPFPGTLAIMQVKVPFITKTGRQSTTTTRQCVLSDEQREWFIRWFPEEENRRLLKATGMSHSTLHRFAREFGLTKSPHGMARIKKRQAASIKRTCTKNGYYASIKGRKPSLQCRQATAKMWKDIREGRREHPFSIMKRENPRKYKQFMRRKSEERRESIRKEKMRVVYGLDRKTRLKSVVLCPYKQSQVSHRYSALRRGYFYMEDCTEGGGERYNIYYDKDTERSAIFERNLIADGFKVIEYKEDEQCQELTNT